MFNVRITTRYQPIKIFRLLLLTVFRLPKKQLCNFRFGRNFVIYGAKVAGEISISAEWGGGEPYLSQRCDFRGNYAL